MFVSLIEIYLQRQHQVLSRREVLVCIHRCNDFHQRVHAFVMFVGCSQCIPMELHVISYFGELMTM